MTTYTLPSGTYYIGDPCYVFNNETWDEVLETTNYFSNHGVHELDGKSFCGASTMYGDGVYVGSDSNTYPVDAGLIGAVDIRIVIAQCKITPDEIVESRCGSIVTFNTPVTVNRTDFGDTIIIGHIMITTNYDHYDENEE